MSEKGNAVYEKVELCYRQIRTKVTFLPKVAIVLGSGLGALAEVIQVVDTVVCVRLYRGDARRHHAGAGSFL